MTIGNRSQQVKLTPLTGERWSGTASLLLFGVLALIIEFQSSPPSRQGPPPRRSHSTLLCFCLLFCACCPLSLSCFHFYAICSNLLLVVMVVKQIIFFTLCVFFKFPIFIKTCLDLPKFCISGVKV